MRRDTIVVATGDMLTSVFGGFVTFSIIGFMAKELRLPIHKVATHGTAIPLFYYYSATSLDSGVKFQRPTSSLSDRQSLEGFLRRGRRCGLYPADQATIVQLIEEDDETLFNNIRHNPLHILHPVLPKQTTVTALGPDLIILNLPTTMTVEILLIECSFAITAALPNTYANLHYGLHNFIVLLSWHFVLHYIVICRIFIAIIAL